MAKQWGSDSKAIGITGRDGGYGFAQRHRGGRRTQRSYFWQSLDLSICLLLSASLVCGRNRGPRGELLPSSLHRGNTTRRDGNAMEMQWQNAGLRRREAAASQPGSNGSYVSHRNTEESGEDSL
jgi:hypothetical protein